MARLRTITIGALNIAMHRPHSPERYVELFTAALKLGRLFQQGEIHGLMLGPLTGRRDAIEKNELSGEIYRFVQVNPDDPWFDLRTRRQAAPEEVERINIPQHLLAHLQSFPFIFYPRQHELWFVSKDRGSSLSIKAAEKFFQALFDQTAAASNFPEIAVTALPDKEKLEELLNLPGLRRLELSFNRPNPDDGGELEAEFEERMANINVGKRHEVLTAPRGQEMEPDAQLQAEARVAARNGKVLGEGVDLDGAPIQMSTEERPARFFKRVNDAIETVKDVLRRARDEQ